MSSLRVIWRFKGYPLRYKWHLAAAYVCLTAAALIALVIPRLLGNAIDETLISGLRSQQLFLAVIIVILGLLRAAIGWAQLLLVNAVHQMAIRDLRIDVFNKLLGLSFGYYDHQRTGDLMSRAMADVTPPLAFISMGLSRTVGLVIMLVVVAGLMVSMNWHLGLISLAFMSVYMWRALFKSHGLQETWRRVRAEDGIMNAVMEENLAGMRVVKAFGAGEHEEAKFEPRASAVSEYTYRAERFWAVRSSVFLFISTVASGTILWVGGREVIAGRLTCTSSKQVGQKGSL